ncbi:MAG: exonuclease domain-containing protein [Brachybacterium tyrofermentans]|uniref:Exonuclease domain-containing protein n=1 Tax=Brachybacterium tyrofermentans TaxID=47848 RepID=A0ABW0FLH7_9MICO|nr:exonuclease domain-containing protein [Brachybacterium tyrofermentans]SLM97091.1 DNA polymerase III subunit epsilon [Corynebacterium xerosis]
MNAPSSWIDAPLLGFDTETTGTNVASDRIVTVALVHSVGPGRENETVATWLIDPEMDIPEPAQRVHGISTEHARAHGMKAAAALEEVVTMIAEALGKDVPLVAFNGGFDLAILENELTRLGLPTLAQRLGHDIAPVIDPLVVDRGVDRYRKGKRTLTDMLALFGIEQDGRLHTADVDVSATLDVLRAIVAKHPQLAASSLADLHREQIGWHRTWAENFNKFLEKKGKTPDVNTNWPL